MRQFVLLLFLLALGLAGCGGDSDERKEGKPPDKTSPRMKKMKFPGGPKT